MSNENISPLRLQMKGIERGFGFRIFEHEGNSGTSYRDGAEVNTGTAEINGEQALVKPGMVAVHRDRTLTEIRKDGVPVELIEAQAFDQGLVEALMRNDEY